MAAPSDPSDRGDPVGTSGRRAPAWVTWLLIAAAVVLVVIHFVLDAGDGGEAPRWIIWAAVVCALAGAFAGASRRR